MTRPAHPRRIVSLVPSLTEALFALGLGERVVGATRFCVHPAEGVARVPKVGGTKDPDVERIAALRPDLVIANHEENTRRAVERLEAAGLCVWVTYPRSVRDAAALLRELAALGAPAAALAGCVEPVERALAVAERRLERARGEGRRPPRVFCAVWKDPWMAVGRDTYADDLIALCGGSNPFAAGVDPRAEAGRGDRRYPRLKQDEIVAAAPEVVLLPDEPYAFGPADAAELAALPLPAARSGRIHLIDGTLVSWYGPRIQRAIETLGPLLAVRGDGE